jgi:hypothetical protein
VIEDAVITYYGHVTRRHFGAVSKRDICKKDFREKDFCKKSKKRECLPRGIGARTGVAIVSRHVD